MVGHIPAAHRRQCYFTPEYCPDQEEVFRCDECGDHSLSKFDVVFQDGRIVCRKCLKWEARYF
ncbi:MAG: hypothetical protein K9M56_04370 [Victivallales bacterium]|nr:hypothetical protein [Victivallales bacterium]